MKLYCPHCGVKGVADDAYRGQMVKCPKCLNTFVAGELAADLAVEDEPSAVVVEESPVAEPPVGSEEEPAGGQPAAAEEAMADEDSASRSAEESPGAPADEAGPEGKEPVLDWEEIVAEVEAKTAVAEEEEARRKEELPASLFADMDGEEPVRPGSEAAATDEGAAAGPEEGELPEQPQTAATATEGREEHFIFEDRQAEPETVEVESEPYGIIREQCWQCGRKNRSGVPYDERGGRLYCPGCLPSEDAASEPPPIPGQLEAAPIPAEDVGSMKEDAPPAGFTISGILREAWEKTRGAKGPIWAGSALMYLTLLFLAAAGAFLLPLAGYDPTAPDLGMAGDIFNFAYNAFVDAVSVLFTAGLLYMGIRKVAGDPIDWKMVFTGYSQAVRIITATVLQAIMIFLGFLVLVLPGIYLAVGYSMTLPLIVDRKMSPWQAMETSRKAVHKVWWRLVGLYLVTMLLFIVSLVPLGLGLIWTWPMCVILAGVVYRSLFGPEK